MRRRGRGDPRSLRWVGGRAAARVLAVTLLALACGDGEPSNGLPGGATAERVSEAEPPAGEAPADPSAAATPAESPAAEPGAGPAGPEGEGDTAQRPPARGFAAPAEESRGDTATVRIRVGGVEVDVEVADQPEQRQEGLMHRDSLPDDRGMLFVYPDERTLSFWMRNTRIPLDIAFLDRRGRIVDVQQMEPFEEEMTTSRRPAMYALEMRRGWFEDHGVGVGDQVEF